jgi:hypothetical protein
LLETRKRIGYDCDSRLSKAGFETTSILKFSALVFNLLASGVSQRRIAEILKLNRKTVVRTFLIEAQQAEVRLFERIQPDHPL